MWIPATIETGVDTVTALQEHVLTALAPYSDGHAATERYAQVARSVAEHCAFDCCQGMPTVALTGQVARALWSVGARDTARCWLQDRVDARSLRTTLEALLPLREVAPGLWRLAADEVIHYRCAWFSGDEAALWVIDLTRVPDWSSYIPLLQSRLLRALLDSVCPVWDDTYGRGTLGLRWFVAEAPASEQTGDEWRQFAGQVLQLASDRRGWRHTPRIVRLAAASSRHPRWLTTGAWPS